MKTWLLWVVLQAPVLSFAAEIQTLPELFNSDLGNARTVQALTKSSCPGELTSSIRGALSSPSLKAFRVTDVRGGERLMIPLSVRLNRTLSAGSDEYRVTFLEYVDGGWIMDTKFIAVDGDLKGTPLRAAAWRDSDSLKDGEIKTARFEVLQSIEPLTRQALQDVLGVPAAALCDLGKQATQDRALQRVLAEGSQTGRELFIRGTLDPIRAAGGDSAR